MTTTLDARAPATARFAVDRTGEETRVTRRIAGSVLAAGVVGMIAGAAVWSSTGTDLWATLTDGTMTQYLADAVEHRSALFANLTLWTIGATGLAVGGMLMSRCADEPEGPTAAVARHLYQLGGALAVVSFVTWMGLVRVAASIDPTTAELIGFMVTRIDDLATIALIGVGPALLALASTWMPRLLRQAAVLVATTSVVSVVALFTDASNSYGFLIVPVGMLWSLAAGIAATRAGR